MVKTLEIDTPQAMIVVHERAGFDSIATSHLHYALAQHISGMQTLPTNYDELNAVVNIEGWVAIVRYTELVQQTRCIQWKGEALFTLPSEYATYPLHCAAFDEIRYMPSDFLKAWVDGIKQVSKTELERQTEGKTAGE